MKNIFVNCKLSPIIYLKKLFLFFVHTVKCESEMKTESISSVLNTFRECVQNIQKLYTLNSKNTIIFDLNQVPVWLLRSYVMAIAHLLTAILLKMRFNTNTPSKISFVLSVTYSFSESKKKNTVFL